MKTVIEMAGEIDAVTEILLYRKEPQGMSHEVFVWFLERFAELVRADALVKPCCGNFTWCQQICMPRAVAAEREACAKVCDAFQARNVGMQPAECAAAIRARSNT